MQRNKRSLYGEVLRAALRKEQVWLKSEDLPSYLRFYVNFGALDRLHDNSNQLIVGRRGTGKTHLLGAFHEYITGKFGNEFSIMISIIEAAPKTPPTVAIETDSFASKRMAKEMFEGFLRVFFKRFLDICHCRLTVLKSEMQRDIYQDIFQRTNNQLVALLEAIEFGRPYTTSKTSLTERRKTKRRASGATGSVSLGFSGATPKLEASAGVTRAGAGDDESNEKIEVRSLISIDLFEVRELVLEILDLLKIDVLYILVDEWMELDKRTPSRLQAGFAQLLKTTFFNSSKLSVKIASVWHETTLYDKNDLEKSQGIQLGHDINLAADLDTSFLTTETDVLTFCKELLFKRLSYVCPEIAELEKDGEISDLFIEELFDNTENFKAFIAASHGIPRDLMNLFQICSLRFKRFFIKHCIDLPLISEVSQRIYKTQKRKHIDPSSSAQKLLGLINAYMERSGRRLFLVENEKAQSSTELRKLVDEELIHQIPSPVTPRSFCDTHKAYHIDFGNYADWLQTRRIDISEILDEFVIPKFPQDIAANIGEFIIDVAEISSVRGECASCEFLFDLSHPVFRKAGICPKCASGEVVGA